MNKVKKRIALVNQRYGLEVNGGSEYYTRMIAEKLNEKYDVEVLSTTALNYDTWENYYDEGLQEINQVKVRRFRVDKKRNLKKFRYINMLLQKFRFKILEPIWIDQQGPVSKDLIRYVSENVNHYDVFIFVTYLYYLTVKGLPKVADKSILIPTAHDEPYIYFNVYKKIFTLPKAIIYLTDEEKRFVNHTFHNENIRNDVIGIGIDVPNNICVEKFRNKFQIQNEYIVYVGRIDLEKGCNQLFDYFIKFKSENNKLNLKLILIGKAMIEIPENPDIIPLGFVSDEDKYNAIAGARALVLPSEYESLSISVLEAMSVSVPVIVNARCAVLKGHCIKSNGGLYYDSYQDFRNCINYVLEDIEDYRRLQLNAKQYIETNYTWDINMKKYDRMIEKM